MRTDPEVDFELLSHYVQKHSKFVDCATRWPLFDRNSPQFHVLVPGGCTQVPTDGSSYQLIVRG